MYYNSHHLLLEYYSILKLINIGTGTCETLLYKEGLYFEYISYRAIFCMINAYW